MEVYGQSQWAEPKRRMGAASKMPIVAVAARVATAVFLAVSLALTKTNRPTHNQDGYEFFLTYKIVTSYEYSLFVMAIAFVYTVIQALFAAYYAIIRKRLISHYRMLLVDFYCDKVISFTLATAVGAYFGFTSDAIRDESYNPEYNSDNKSMYDSFYMMGILAASFLLIGSICSLVSSIISSRALAEEE